MLEHALRLAARGLQVFPCHSISDGECTCREVCDSPGKHPRVKKWREAATSDEAQIREWWEKWPDANPAIATGLGSGCFVVDIDPRNDGFTSLEALLAERGELPETFSVATGGGGAHLFYRHPDSSIENPMRRSWRKQIAGGVDIKGDGGYVIAAGSLHASGKHYTVEIDAAIAEAPAWLVELASKPRESIVPEATPWTPIAHTNLAAVHEYAREIADKHESAVEGEGGSTPTLVVAILLYKGLGLPDDGDTRAIYDRYLQRCTPPWSDETQIRHKIENAKESDKRLGFKLGEFKVWRWIKKRCAARVKRPVVKVVPDEEEVADQVVNAFVKQDRFYDRGGVLVDIIDSEPPTKKLVELPLPRVREAISSVVRLEKFDKRSMEWLHSYVPDWLARAVAARGSWGSLRRIRALSTIPILRPDGSVHAEAGYDPATMVYYAPTCELPPLTAEPTRADALAARDLLCDVVCDFPFDEPVHRAAWLAALLTPFCRHAFEGPAPLTFVDANVRGSGKTMLVEVIGTIHTGRASLPKMAPTSEEEEMRKRITSVAIGGAPSVLIDNVQGLFGGASIDTLLTGTRWSDRLLGVNKSIDMEVRTTWYATGNNVAFKGDTARRVLHVRLCSHEERPEERQEFRHPHLLDYVRTNRGRLLHACVTILRAHAVAGKPRSGGMQWGSFENWCSTVRDALTWLGEPDPVQAKLKMEEMADREGNAVAQLINGWEEIQTALGGRATVAQVLGKLNEMPGIMKYGAIRGAFAELCGTSGTQLPSGKSVGAYLRKFRERVVNGKMLRQDGAAHAGVVYWRVVPAR